MFPLTDQAEECTESVVQVVAESVRQPTHGGLAEVHLAQWSHLQGYDVHVWTQVRLGPTVFRGWQSPLVRG